jgi:hypothetical protein
MEPDTQIQDFYTALEDLNLLKEYTENTVKCMVGYYPDLTVLPEDLLDRTVFEDYIRQYVDDGDYLESFGQLLKNSFAFAGTPQGFEFWYNLSKYL